ncbi:recombinase family protein [Bradyrhizobium barranii subsp. barranii]|uniref:Recombinase family protein n=1 Tax=Bradyrhizobium barranii subsp. barranii TaxID=2823807 RepID=A0A7Z0QCM8_9BRAD|nr:recombinase family protein [Bradyrhizobium barranii]UGX92933.1 recombinase family protein [Bradyrhizobium barranii subsp. barranii]
MAEGVFVAYYRVSTKGQKRSGLGLDAQQEAVRNYLNGGRWSLAEAFTEVESGKRDENRPQLARALQTCRVYGAKLVIAKLDRLSRDAHFLLGLEKAGVDFVAADMPHANRLTVGIMAMVADEERRAISDRTKAALAAAKRRGVALGGDRGAKLSRAARKAGRDVQVARANDRAADLAHIIRDLQSTGIVSLSGIARALTERRVPTPRGSTDWSAVQVARTVARL